MKNLAYLLLFISCTTSDLPPDEKCGLIIDKRIAELTSKTCYDIKVVNEVTNDTLNYCIDKQDWEIFTKGNTYCKR